MLEDKLNWTDTQTHGQTLFCYFFRDKLSLLRSSYWITALHYLHNSKVSSSILLDFMDLKMMRLTNPKEIFVMRALQTKNGILYNQQFFANTLKQHTLQCLAMRCLQQTQSSLKQISQALQQRNPT